MRRLFTLSLLALLVAATAVPTLSAEDVAELELMLAATELGRQYDANYNDKKPAAMAALYTSDGVLLSPSGSVVRGREALTTYYAERFASGARGHAIKVIEVHVQGNGGYGLAHFSVMAPRATAISMRWMAASSRSISATPMGGTCALSKLASSQNRPKNSDQDGFVRSSRYGSISKRRLCLPG